MRCRDCKLCLKGAGEERKSMMQEAHQEFIRQSVSIDKELGRAVAKLPFVVDPVGKLTNNTRWQLEGWTMFVGSMLMMTISSR